MHIHFLQKGATKCLNIKGVKHSVVKGNQKQSAIISCRIVIKGIVHVDQEVKRP
ncbi:hypothetical protein Nmel_004289 [Mimus melanotis]